MARYDVKVKVTYFYEVEAEDDIEAEKQGWMYQNHAYNAEVQEINVYYLEDDEDMEKEEE
jgi:hypothetical protein